MSRYSVLLGLVGIHLGILGLIVAAGSPEIAKQSGNAAWFGGFFWLIGVIFLVGAYLEETRAERIPR